MAKEALEVRGPICHQVELMRLHFHLEGMSYYGCLHINDLYFWPLEENGALSLACFQVFDIGKGMAVPQV